MTDGLKSGSLLSPGVSRRDMIGAGVLWAIVVSMSVAMATQAGSDWLQSADDHVWRFAVDHENGVLVGLGRLLGMIGSGWVMNPFAIGVAAYLWYRRRRDVFIVWVLGIGIAEIVVYVFKLLYARPRPPLPLVHTSTYSFPSGHSVTAAAVSIGLVLVFASSHRSQRLGSALAIAWILLIMWSRVYVRAHWLSDVVTGAAIGGAVIMTIATLISNRADD